MTIPLPSVGTEHDQTTQPYDGLHADDVPFTQYLRPDGRTRPVWVTRSPEIAALAQRLLTAGYHFDIEELMDGTVSMTVEPNAPDADGEDAPIAMEQCANGPAVPAAVDRLITIAAARVK